MRTKLFVITSFAIAGAAAILTAPVASAADTQSCVAQISATLCQSPGNAQFQTAPPAGPPPPILPTGRSSAMTAAVGHR